MNLSVLHCHNFHRIVGGADVTYFRTTALLERAGHRVVPFATAHPDNVPTPWSSHFVSEADFRGLGVGHPVKTAGHALRMVYSFEARRKLRRLLACFSPDIAHLHNIYHEMSPSILHELSAHGIPSVLTAHDLKLVCPNYRMYVNEHVCDDCLGGRYISAVSKKCVGGSVIASALCAIEGYIHRLLGMYDRHLAAIICPSQFVRDQLLKGGYKTRLIYVPTPVRPLESVSPPGSSDYVLYYGVLLPHKGLTTLLDAAKLVPDIPIKIAGRGAMEPELRRMIDESSLEDVSLIGFRTPQELLELLGHCRFSVTPSVWPENSPLSVLESFASGRAVIGSDIGGIPELIEDGVHGYVVPPGNAEALAERMRALWNDRLTALEMGRNAHEMVKQKHSEEVYLKSLLELYRSVIRTS